MKTIHATTGRLLTMAIVAILGTGILAGFALVASGADYSPSGSLAFDGVNDYVTFGQATSALGASNFTLECWFKRTGTGATTTTGNGGSTAVPLLTKGRGEADGSNVDCNYFLGISTNGTLTADFEEYPVSGGTSGLNHPVTGRTAIVNGTWYHAAVTYNSRQWSLYLNGNIETTLVVNASADRPPRFDSLQHAALGSALTSVGAAAGYFQGLIDEARVWNVVRSQAEIRDGMYAEIVSAPGLLGRWGLNESTGTTASNSVSGSPSGTLMNAPAWSNEVPPQVAINTVWKYLDNGSDQGAAWCAIGFDDSTWASGPAELGYGDGDERTIVSYGPVSTNKYVTTYFRRAFTVADPASFGRLNLRAIRDDGIIVYLNGTEIWRDNMPAGTIAYNTYASSPEISGAAESTWQVMNVAADALVGGVNVVAVEIHQQRAASSDISFNFELSGVSPLGNQAPTVTLTAPAAGSVLPTGTPVTMAATATDDGTVTNVEFLVNGAKAGEDTASPFVFDWTPSAPGRASLAAVATDNLGLTGVSSAVGVVCYEPGTGALQFDGVNDHVTFGQAVNLGASNFTLECWMRKLGPGLTSSSGSGGISAVPLITKGRGEAENSNVDCNYFFGLLPGGALGADFEQFYADGGGAAGQNYPVTGNSTAAGDGGWHHVAVTYDGSNWVLYLDGAVDRTLNIGKHTPRFDSIQHAGLGVAMTSVGATEGAFEGVMDDARIWNYARSAAQIAANMSNAIVSANGLIGRWSLNDGSGTTAANSIAGQPDGSLVNGPIWCLGRTLGSPGPSAPYVTLIAPPGGSTFDVGTDVMLTAQATDDDGIIVLVDLLVDGLSIGVTAGSPSYSLTWHAVAGTHALTAVATDNDGLSATSAPVNVTVVVPNLPPTVTLLSPSAGASDVIIPAALSAQVTDPEGLPLTVEFYGRPRGVIPAPGPDFTVVALPDTQFYSQDYPSIFQNQTDWIVANRTNLNIVYVAHLGDMTDDADSQMYQWTNCANAMYRLEDPVTTGLPEGIPYGPLLGNHDHVGGTAGFNQFFGVPHFSAKPWYSGHMGADNQNHYDLISAGGLDFVIVFMDWNYDSLDYAPIDAWSDGVLKANASRRAIVVNHDILAVGGAWDPRGQAIYDNLKDNPNLFLMLCGHNAGEGKRQDTFEGRTVYSCLSDYQNYANGGNGFLRLYRFSPSNNVIHVQTYSPYLNQHETDADSQFDLAYDMSAAAVSFELIGTSNNVASGSTVILPWSGLLPGSNYEWKVVAGDGVNSATSAVASFTTATSLSAAPTIRHDGGSTVMTAVTTQVVGTNGTWKYLDNGTDQGTAWQAPAFDDSSWASGPAPLGYGDPWIVTTMYSPPAPNRYITTYFRRHFTAPTGPVWTNLALSLMRDDGAVIYLNGDEVLRDNMPTGAIDYLTWSSTIVGGADEYTFFPFNRDASGVVTGDNVLAVELHQRDGTSSDLTFDLGVTLQGYTTTPGGSAVSDVTAHSTVLHGEVTSEGGQTPGVIVYYGTTDGGTDTNLWQRSLDLGPRPVGRVSGTVTGLDPNTTYFFRYMASNAFGQGWADASESWTTLAETVPVVSLTSPTNGAVYTNGQTVTLAATATDDGSVTNVSFFVDGAPAGSDATEPYTATWTATTVGGHALTAVAWDDAGLAATSATVNVTVALLTPAGIPFGPAGTGMLTFDSLPPSAQWATASVGADKYAYTTIAQINVAVDALGANAIVNTLVSSTAALPSANGQAVWTSGGSAFVQTCPTGIGATLLKATLVNNSGGDLTAVRLTYQYTVVNLRTEDVPGQHVFCSLTGAAGSWTPIAALSGVTGSTSFDVTVTLPMTWANGAVLYLLWADDNDTTYSPDTYFQIDDFAAGPAGPAPFTVTLTTPTNGQTFASGAPMLMQAVTSGVTSATVTDVQFRADGAVVGESITSPYVFTWNGASVGPHALDAVALLDSGEAVTSAVVNVTVFNQPPAALVVAPTDGATGVDVAPALTVEVSDPDDSALSIVFYGRTVTNAPAGPDFTIAVLPDTQNYCSYYPQIFQAQTDWIVANHAVSNIVYVAGEGDIVNNAGSVAEYQVATSALYRLENPATTGLPDGIPYGTAVGNHDQPTTLYNQYFGANHFAGRSYYGGNYGANNDSHYDLFSASGMDFIVLYITMGGGNDSALMTWANGVLQGNASRRAIVVSHSILNVTTRPTPSTWTGEGQPLFDALKGNTNLFLMLCGHMHGEGFRHETLPDGRMIDILLADYQDYPNGGDGLLRLMTFSSSNNQIRVATFSPYTGVWRTGPDSRFDLDYTMAAPPTPFVALGTNTGVASGTQTSVMWPGRDWNTSYEWYSSVSDGTSERQSAISRFTTRARPDPVLTISSANGTPVPAGVTTQMWGSTISATVDAIVSGGATQYLCTGWTGAGSAPASGTGNSVTFTITNNTTLTWNWRTEYWLDTVAGDGGSVSVVDGWYASGQVVSVTATPDSGFRFVGWTGSATSTNDTLVLTMNQAYSVTAAFEPILVTLTVISPRGSPIPSGVSTQFLGSVVAATVRPIVSGGATQYVCTGWTGTGSAPASGSGNSVTFTITQNSTLTWNWRTEYWLDTEAGEGGAVDVADGWQASGRVVTVTATADNGFGFTGWTGDVTVTSNPLVIRINGSLRVTACFARSAVPIHYVNVAGINPVWPYGSWATAARNIQDAVDAAADGETVLVTNGVYNTGARVTPGGAILNRVVVTNAITIMSVNGPDVTVITGSGPLGDGAVRCVYLAGNATIERFTLSDGCTRLVGNDALDRSGGGVFSPGYGVVSNCVVSSNSADYAGGGVYNCSVRSSKLIGNSANYCGGGARYGVLRDCELRDNTASTIWDGGGADGCTLENCALTGNSAGYGGAVSDSIVSDCTLSGNSAVNDGGAAYGCIMDNCDVTDNSANYGGGLYDVIADNCSFSNNTASWMGGGAFYSTLNNCEVTLNLAYEGAGAYYSALINCLVTGNRASQYGGGAEGSALINCTVSGNRAKYGGGVFGGGLHNCIVWGNTATYGANWYSDCAMDYSCATPAPAGEGNIAQDPAFVNAAQGDYRLAANSPCIDAGDNSRAQGAFDLGGNPRILDGNNDGMAIVDMGAYENRGLNPPAAHVTVNGSHGGITITTRDTLTVSVSLSAGSFVNVPVDWWVLAETPFGWYYYQLPSGQWKPGFTATASGPLGNIQKMDILAIRPPTAGTYQFYFGVDYSMNGILDTDLLFYDGVEVTVTP